MSGYYDRQGKPMDLMEWARRFEDMTYKRVARTEIPGVGTVSTVWLGSDHQFLPNGPPLIFESMLFPEHCEQDRDQDRYTTEEEAVAGHQAMVQKWSPKQ